MIETFYNFKRDKTVVKMSYPGQPPMGIPGMPPMPYMVGAPPPMMMPMPPHVNFILCIS